MGDLSMTANYPSGFTQGVTVRGVPIHLAHPGEVFWVNNSGVNLANSKGASDSGKGTMLSPFSSIDYAIGRCRAGRGDVILVAPGHTETVTAAGGITLDVDGVCIYGLGVGAARPTITFTTANTSRISWTADNCTMKNIRFVGNFLSIATCILNSGGASWTIEDCLFADTSAILGFLACVTTTVSTNSDNGYFANNERRSDATTTPGTAIKVLNTTAGLTIENNRFWHTVIEENIAVVLDHAALVVNKLLMRGNLVYSVNIATDTEGFLVKTSATTGSGIICNNYVRSQDPSAAILVTAGAVQYGMFENYHIGDVTSVSAVLVPAAGAN
jgi:hypothetical protein